jgi:hypothetical protein
VISSLVPSGWALSELGDMEGACQKIAASVVERVSLGVQPSFYSWAFFEKLKEEPAVRDLRRHLIAGNGTEFSFQSRATE